MEIFANAVRHALSKNPDAIPSLFDHLGVFGAIAVIALTALAFYLIGLGLRRLGEWLEDKENEWRIRHGKGGK